MKHAYTSLCRLEAALTAAVAFAVVSIGGAAAAHAQGLPSYATGEESIRGRIVSLDGSHGLALRDDRGFIDNVRLHDGTIINPTGLRLAPGQSVTILGHTDGQAFEANEIDTPYTRYPAESYDYPAYPYYGYGGPYYGYGGPYGYDGYPYPVAYGPRLGFGIRERGFRFGGRF